MIEAEARKLDALIPTLCTRCGRSSAIKSSVPINQPGQSVSIAGKPATTTG